MEGKPVRSHNYFLACYMASLAQGDTILGGQIRSCTLRHYLSDARRLFDRRKIICYCPDDVDYADLIIKTVRDYESIPNRRNMITDGMMIWLQHAASKGKD